MKLINTNNWKRKEYFDFYSKYEDPFLGIVSRVECTSDYLKAKSQKTSFFSSYLHKALIVINQIEEFKFRILDNKVVMYEQIHCASTIGRKDNSFAFSFCLFNKDYHQFDINLKNEISQVEKSTGLREVNDGYRMDVIYFSTLPWTTFTGIKHPVKLGTKESIPKITFGKVYQKEGKWFMPVSVDIHHGFADGYHVSKFFENFEKLLNKNHTH